MSVKRKHWHMISLKVSEVEHLTSMSEIKQYPYNLIILWEGRGYQLVYANLELSELVSECVRMCSFLKEIHF